MSDLVYMLLIFSFTIIKTFYMHNQHVIKSLKQFMTPQASANIKYRENKKTHEKNKNF
jgi:hypothetical protein